MPNVTPNKIDLFVQELVESSKIHGRIKPLHQNSPLVKLGCNAREGINC
jgi:hypothetical protein